MVCWRRIQISASNISSLISSRGLYLRNLAPELPTAVIKHSDKIAKRSITKILRALHTSDKGMFTRAKWSHNLRFRASSYRPWYILTRQWRLTTNYKNAIFDFGPSYLDHTCPFKILYRNYAWLVCIEPGQKKIKRSKSDLVSIALSGQKIPFL